MSGATGGYSGSPCAWQAAAAGGSAAPPTPCRAAGTRQHPARHPDRQSSAGGRRSGCRLDWVGHPGGEARAQEAGLLSEPSPPHSLTCYPPTHTPHPYLYHQVSGRISGQLGKLCGQLSEGGTTGWIDHPT